MLTPLSWLKDYVDIDVTPKELEEKLFSCGFEVEESYEVGKDISNVVVGLVEKCEPIPETHLSGKCRSTWHIPDLLWSGQCKGRGQISSRTYRCHSICHSKGSRYNRGRDGDKAGQAAWI